MKLEVGIYVRTEEGKIFKTDGDLIYLSNDKTILYRLITRVPHDSVSYKVVKASFNIIDLIEENDYVNGLRVEKNKYGELYTSYVYYGGNIGKQCEVYTTWLKDYKVEDIKTIVTKEQFEQMSYKLGG